MNKQPTVLIVDDIEDNRLAIKLSLKREEYTFIEATNGSEAAQLAIEHRPDVILMDAMMPVMDGFEASEQIRAERKTERIPILMITALSDNEDKLKAIEAGVNDFISKPFNRLELITRCRAYINMNRLNNQYILSTINPLSDMPNKVALLRDIKEMEEGALFLMQIDDYDNIGQFYTLEIAQKIELIFAQRIKSTLPESFQCHDIYHYGDGRFALLCDIAKYPLSKEDAHNTCEQIVSKTKNSTILVDNNEYDIGVTMSFTSSVDNLFEQGRVTLRRAIKDKREYIFSEDIMEQTQRDSENNILWIKKIKQAIANDNIIPYFQPIIDVKTGKIEKYEALVRIIDENGYTIAPFEFLNISKRGRYYSFITETVIDKSIEHFKDLDKELTINLSALDIEQKKMRNFILTRLKENPHIASKMVFELLEDENFKSFDIVKEFIKEVKSMGTRIAIDDFGSGYSNFQRLLDFEPDIIKIDGSLIRNIAVNNYNRHIVKTIHDFASKLNIQTVAEFVSSKEILDIISDIGIGYAQGYYFSEPMSVDEIL